jgi:hypothetical protein
MATTPSKLLLGSSFEDFTSAIGLDSSSIDDVSVYHLMLVLRPLCYTHLHTHIDTIDSTKHGKDALD